MMISNNIDNNPSNDVNSAKVWAIAWPMILSGISIPMLGLVDTALLGHLDNPRYLAAVAIGAAAAVPGTLVNIAAGGGERSAVRFGHPSGTLRVGAEAIEQAGKWTVVKASMSRSARTLMEGWVRVPPLD